MGRSSRVGVVGDVGGVWTSYALAGNLSIAELGLQAGASSGADDDSLRTKVSGESLRCLGLPYHVSWLEGSASKDEDDVFASAIEVVRIQLTFVKRAGDREGSKYSESSNTEEGLHCVSRNEEAKE